MTVNYTKLYNIALITFFALLIALPFLAYGNVKLQDKSYTTISGKVTSVISDDQFWLKHANGNIMVDVNDGHPNLFKGNLKKYLKVGSDVVVSGIVDNNLLARNEIDAVAVDVNNNGSIITYGYYPEINSSSNQNNYIRVYSSEPEFVSQDRVKISGYVNSLVNNNEFILTNGTGAIRVDASKFDLTNSSQFKIGDYVVVEGNLEGNIYQDSEVEADSITKVVML